MRTNLLFLVGIVLFVIISVFSAIFLKRHFDEQKQDLLRSLPKIPKTEESSRITLHMDAEGTLAMDGQPLTIEELAHKLEALDQKSVAAHLTLETTGNAPENLISRVLDTCAKAGISNVSLTSRPSADAP